jgi:hypothetical protein
MSNYATSFERVSLNLSILLKSDTMGDNDEVDDLDAQIAELQAKRAAKLAKAEIARKIEEKKAKDILIGTTPTKGMYTQTVL